MQPGGSLPSDMNGLRRPQLSSQSGQVLVLLAVLLPLFFAVCMLVIDGSRLFVQKRSMQNAADAATVAAVRELNDDGTACTGPASDTTTCLYRVKTIAEQYARDNGWEGTLHACDPSDAADTNCYLTPYKSDNGKLLVRLE